jgi:hypothetical protein
MFKSLAFAIALWLAVGSAAVIARTGSHGHDAGQARGPQASSNAYAEANAKMHKDIAIADTENADVVLCAA